MREILFRGKSVYKDFLSNKKVWYEGFLFEKSDDCDVMCISREPLSANDYSEILGDYVEVIPDTVGQYTGLTDKNGVKIFEGDILKQKTTSEFAKVNSYEWERYGIVRFGYYDWSKGEAGRASMGWYIEHLKSVSINPKNYRMGHIQGGLNQSDILNMYYPMEVIGNIHDNSELLGE